jgi:hypothetical protein
MTAFISGPAGTGKTSELLRRAEEAARSGPILVTAPGPSAIRMLRERITHPGACVKALHEIALDLFAQGEQIDDVRAMMLFEETALPLLTLEWVEIAQAQIDPEVPGLRVPERFLDAAFRLFCKLRDARISPEQFLESARRGATQFYAKPPNLAHPDLLHYTKDNHRGSLNADGAELQRQYRREIDLAKILSKLYRTYLSHPVKSGCMTARDAIAAAADLLEQSPAKAAELRARYPKAFVDEAEELTLGELQLLQAIYGPELDAVTQPLRGRRRCAPSPFGGRNAARQHGRTRRFAALSRKHALCGGAIHRGTRRELVEFGSLARRRRLDFPYGCGCTPLRRRVARSQRPHANRGKSESVRAAVSAGCARDPVAGPRSLPP